MSDKVNYCAWPEGPRGPGPAGRCAVPGHRRKVRKVRAVLALLALAAGLLAATGASYLAGHTHGEVDPRGGYAWLAVDAGPGQVTAYAAGGPGNSHTTGLRYDRQDTTTADIASLTTYAGLNVGVAATVAGHCGGGFEVWPLPGGMFLSCG